MDNWLISHDLPAAGRRGAGLAARRGGPRRRPRRCALVTSLVTLGLAACLIVRIIRRRRHELRRDRLCLGSAMRATPRSIFASASASTALACGCSASRRCLTVTSVLVSWEAIDDRPAGVLRAAAAARVRHAGRVRRPRHHPVLHLLRVHADPAVLPDRHLGQRRAALRRDQVLPVHAGRQPAHVPGPAGDRALALATTTGDADVSHSRADRRAARAPDPERLLPAICNC